MCSWTSSLVSSSSSSGMTDARGPSAHGLRASPWWLERQSQERYVAWHAQCGGPQVQWQQVQAARGNLKGLQQQAVVMGVCCLLSCRLAAWGLGLLLGVALKDAVGMLKSCKRLHDMHSLSRLAFGYVVHAALLNHRACDG